MGNPDFGEDLSDERVAEFFLEGGGGQAGVENKAGRPSGSPLRLHRFEQAASASLPLPGRIHGHLAEFYFARCHGGDDHQGDNGFAIEQSVVRLRGLHLGIFRVDKGLPKAAHTSDALGEGMNELKFVVEVG